MRRRSALTFDDFREYVGNHSSSLVLWREPREMLRPLLGWINTQLVVEQRTAALEGGATGPLPHLYRHHNQAGIAVAWAMRYLGAQPERASREPERLHMLELAGRHWEVLNLLAEVRQGVRGFEAAGTRITMPFTGDHDLDALDRMLGIVDVVMSVPDPDSVDEPLVGAWLRSKQAPTPWPSAPARLQAALREMAQRTVSGYPRPLPGDLDLGGFTLDHVALVWVELLAPALYTQAALMKGSTEPSIAAPIEPVAGLVTSAASATGLAEEVVQKVLDLLTFDPDHEPDPCLTPLIPVALGSVVPMSGLILPGSIFRNVTALVQRQPAAFGEGGRRLGAIGAEAVAATLRERLSGAHVAKGVKLKRDDGTPAGDLDVVAFDASQRILVAIEVLWRIAPDGAAQGFAHEEAAHDKRMQVARVRAQLAEGSAQPMWPAGWPDVAGAEWRWYIVTPSVLPVRQVEDDGITIRSHQLIARMLPSAASVAGLIAVMDHPPLPPRLAEGTTWDRIRYGDFRVDHESTL